ncbi:DUF2935 domain-containing protein [Effusibacillus lacus]|uniref:DUF2935 domain-containing protein n=1 Tax=Effusibacillus lacus TaxID=1348429 RepID=A0A292YLF7_9BACL|nr:DUF2935 domain-containing protein [Effusibacillus lacus]TCS73569.1 DUF2935 family protein [Effusibacillus lacus]GAX91937.1 hypothetical protein EFBL_3628 [Effusibacillus lacus]
MHPPSFRETALFEHRFWLQILGDHARFILTSLSPRETKEIERANKFIREYDKYLEQVRRTPTDSEIKALGQQALQLTEDLREFKLHLLRRHLAGEVEIGLPPTFFNHMLNELAEYITLLTYLTDGKTPPPMHPVHHHLLWLLDAAGHAATINDSVDPVEKRIKEKSHEFTRHFEEYYLKAVEMAGYLRTHLDRFPALSRFNRETELEMKLFTEFLKELEELELNDSLLGALSPLITDHMFREECYYLTKLAQVSEVSPPGCDPTKPRTEEPKK